MRGPLFTSSLLVFLSLTLCAGSACRYMDDDLLLSDEDFEASFDEEFGVGGLGLSGSYGSGCGGGWSRHGRTHRRMHPSIRLGSEAHDVEGMSEQALLALEQAEAGAWRAPAESREEEAPALALDGVGRNHRVVELIAAGARP